MYSLIHVTLVSNNADYFTIDDGDALFNNQQKIRILQYVQANLVISSIGIDEIG